MRSLPVPYGQRFGRLVVTGPAPRIDKNTRWECRCDCGNVIGCRPAHLKNGNIRSCGCLASEAARDRLTTHGRSRSPMYARWIGMLTRCYYPETNGYRHYGGRGIRVCDRWRNSFADFLADMGEPPGPGYSLDRIDVNGNYAPGNVRWATAREQALNTRRNLGRKDMSHADIRKNLVLIRGNRNNPQIVRSWATQLVQNMDDLKETPGDAELLAQFKENSVMFERAKAGDLDRPAQVLSPAEIAAALGLGRHSDRLQ